MALPGFLRFGARALHCTVVLRGFLFVGTWTWFYVTLYVLALPVVLYLLAVGLGACADLYLLVIGLHITWTFSIFGLLRSGTLRPGPLRPGALRPGLRLPGALLVTTMFSVANSTNYNILYNSNIPVFNGILADYREYRRRIKLYMGKMKLLKREAEGVLNMIQRSLMRLIAS